MAEEKIHYYATRYQAGKATPEEIKTLVRLLYEEKNEKKTAVWILNDCMGKAKDSHLQLLYLYEALRAIRVFQSTLYETYEAALYRKLEALAEREAVHSYGNLSILYDCMEDAAKRQDFLCYNKLEQIWKPYWKNDPVWNLRFRRLKREIGRQKVAGKIFDLLKNENGQGNYACEENKGTYKSAWHTGIAEKHLLTGFLVCLTIVFLLIFLTAPAISRHRQAQKEAVYLEQHNLWLTEEELSKLKKIEETYAKKNDYAIRYVQLSEGEDAEVFLKKNSLENKGIYFLIKQYDGLHTYELKTRGLEESLREQLWNDMVDLFESDKTDYEKCEQYFKLAAERIKERQEE